MMLFTPENAKKVMAGQKTQTRRPCQDGDKGISLEINGLYFAVENNLRKKWQVGKTYAIQPGRGKLSIGRVLLKSIKRERVNEISADDAFYEGVRMPTLPNETPGKFVSAFRDLWDSIYSGGMAFETGPMVWVLEFEVAQ
jgi:hypothetical protein